MGISIYARRMYVRLRIPLERPGVQGETIAGQNLRRLSIADPGPSAMCAARRPEIAVLIRRAAAEEVVAMSDH